MIKFTDILISDLESVKDFTIEENPNRPNLEHTRCIISWEGTANSAITELNPNHYSRVEARAYYSNPDNGFEPYP